MKKRRPGILYVVFVIAFIVLLAGMNSMILLGIDDTEKFVKSDRSFESNSRVFLNLSELETYSDLSESLYVGGWAFCETESNNADKAYDIILQNEDNTYIVHAKAVTRRDVGGNVGGKKVASTLNGIEVRASTIGVKDGTYRLLIHVWENEDNYGLIDTGFKIIKSKDQFEELKYELITAPVNAEISEAVKKNAKVALQNDVLRISGWCFIEELDTDNQEVMIMTQTTDGERIYSARKGSRLDVMTHFENDDYLYSGFEVEIPDWEGIEAYAVCIKVGDEVLRTEWEAIDLPLE
ncbi:MAG: hypothetical protein J1E43_04120 [Christensenellaceae bacterium]|nr:hypothetical protein [Christensenellaceae bacterium]